MTNNIGSKRNITTSRVICISPFMAPLSNAEAFCGAKLIKKLQDLEVDVTVISIDYSGHEKFSYDDFAIWNQVVLATHKIPPHGNLGKQFSLPLGVRYNTITWARWIHDCVRKISLQHLKDPFDAIYTRSFPNVAHIAGYWLSRKFGLPWIANLNDPWDLEGLHLMPQDRHLKRKCFNSLLSDWWLLRVMKFADILTFPNARLRDYHLRLYDVRQRCALIPHIGYCGETNQYCCTNTDKFRLVHAGNLGSGESTRRNSTVHLLRGLKAFLNQYPEAKNKTQLLLVGQKDSQTESIISELLLENNVVFTGRVTYKESLEYIALATACILVEGKMPEGIYLPSKLADYIMSRKPVIALSPAVGVVADLTPLGGITRVDVDDEEGINKTIAFHFEINKKGRIEDIQPGRSLIEYFSEDQVGRAFVGLIESVIKEKNK